jgi:uncharacterized Zn finger protein (UPF0148 family)
MNTDDQGQDIPDSVFSMEDVCPDCGAAKFELRNYSEIWHDGDIHCAKCGTFIRRFDAG